MFIKEVLELSDGVEFSGSYIISEINLKPFKNKDAYYLSFVLQDKTGRIFGKIWDNADKIDLKKSQIVFIEGKINQFKGTNQAVVESFKVLDEDKIDRSDFIRSAIEDTNKMYAEMISIIAEYITDKDILKVTQIFIDDENFKEMFKECPGGKGDVHHAYLGGLLEHILGVMRICVDLSKRYNINTSILIAGAFLHDIGKLVSYNYEGLAIEMTDLGRLHGHIALGYNYFLKIIDDVEIDENKKHELKTILGHLILSHHGSIEQQAVQLPMTLEAMLLAHADAIDADINHITNICEKYDYGWTSYDNLRGRMYYLGQKK